jgi:hypothetical protein
MLARRRRHALAALMLACAVGPALAQPTGGKGNLALDYLAPLRAKSCPKGVARTDGEAVAMTATPVPLQGVDRSRRTVGALTYVGGFHLVSPDKRFGGLSGIDFLDDGNLLAVSDQGDFVWIDLSEDDFTPKGARIANLRDASGNSLRGKADGDAEGLAVNDGLALVSFERNHRVLAFDVGACGASARGAPIAFSRYGGELSAAFDRQELKVDPNSGAEGLAVTPDWFVFTSLESQLGSSSKAGKTSPLSARAIEAAPEFDLSIGRGAPPAVGLDIVPDGNDVRVFSLHRSPNALASNVITLVETRFTRESDQSDLPARPVGVNDSRSHVRFEPGVTRVLAEMNVFLTIDNFEGVAARQMPDGRVRLYVIADDNFSAKQRTLLMVYDVPPRG